MGEAIQFLVQYGYLVIFIGVLLDQVGFPVPAAPFLLGAGVLVGSGELSFLGVVIVTLLASVPADFLWYSLGRARGGKVLNLLCSIAFEPDYCVRNTEATFKKLGLFSLVIAKFVPGLQTIAPPMAGMTGVPVIRFLVLDTLGALLWCVCFTSLGLWFHEELEQIAARFSALGAWAAVILGTALVLYIGSKFVQRQLFIRTLRMRRMNPDEVFELLESGQSPHIIDLRHQYDFDLLPETIPTSQRIPMEFIDEHVDQIPKDQDVILYCS